MGTRRILVVALSLMLATSGCRWIVRASVDSAGNQGNDHSLGEVALSADGRFVAFVSNASNLVPNDTNGAPDVFVRDNRTGEVEKVFETISSPTITTLVGLSEDGRYVAARTHAPCGGTGTQSGLFIHDRQTGTTECIPGLVLGPEAWAISATARFIAHGLTSSIGVLDRETGQTDTIPAPAGRVITGGLHLSDDGRHAVFEAEIPAKPCPPFPDCCLPPTNPGCPAVPGAFVHDRQTDTTESLPLPPPDAQYATNPAISGDGRWVAYDIVSGTPQDPEGVRGETWLYDRQTGVVEPVSVRPDGTVGGSREPTISDDGRYVAFIGELGLDPTIPPTPPYSGLYVRDMAEDRTSFLARNVFDVPVQFPQVSDPTLADDGRYIAFTSPNATLVGDDTNGVSDIFVRAIPTPDIESVTPASLPRGTSATLTIVGTGFAPVPTAIVSGQGVTVTAVNRISEHELSVAIIVDDLAATGTRTLAVTNSGTGPGPTAGDTGGCTCLTIA